MPVPERAEIGLRMKAINNCFIVMGLPAAAHNRYHQKRKLSKLLMFNWVGLLFDGVNLTAEDQGKAFLAGKFFATL